MLQMLFFLVTCGTVLPSEMDIKALIIPGRLPCFADFYALKQVCFVMAGILLVLCIRYMGMYVHVGRSVYSVVSTLSY